MNIATALNKKYVLYTGVMLYSLAKNQTEHIDAFLLHSELDDNDIRVIKDTLNGLDISIIPLHVDKSKFDDRLPRNTQWSLETYYRLMLFDLLPKSVDRLLYLDVDMIINKNLDVLYHAGFGKAELIACADSCGLPYKYYLSDIQIAMFRDMLDRGYQYFNAGMVLFNVSEMRERYNFDFYARVMQEDWKFKMRAPDQDILNYVHGSKVAYADWSEFDLFARIAHEHGITYDEVKEQTSIIHFPGSKPWESSDYHYDIEQIWWDYAKETILYPQLSESFLLSSMSDKLVEMRIRQEKERSKKLLNLVDRLNKERHVSVIASPTRLSQVS